MKIIKFIAARGEKDSGRRAILKAMAVKQGTSSDQDIDELLDGSSDRRIQVPAYLGNVLRNIGKICDEGHNITFDSVQVIVRDKGGAEPCKFHRTSGRLYVAKMKLHHLAGLPRQG